MAFNGRVIPIDPIRDELIHFYQGEVAAGRMTPTQMNHELRSEWAGSFSPNYAGETRLSDMPYGSIIGTPADATRIGRDFSNSLSLDANGMTRGQRESQAQWQREEYERTRAREEATNQGLEQEIDADIAASRAAEQQRQADRLTRPPAWNNPNLLVPAYDDLSGESPTYTPPPGPVWSERFPGDNLPPDWTWGRTVGGFLEGLVPLPDYVSQGIGSGIDNPDGWFRNLFNGSESEAPPSQGGNPGGGFFGTPPPSGGGNPNSSAPPFSTPQPQIGGGNQATPNYAPTPGGSGAGSPVVSPGAGVPNNQGGGGGGGGGDFGLNVLRDESAGGGGGGDGMGRGNRQNGQNRRGRRSVLTPEQIQLLSSITGQVQSDIGGGQGFGLDPLAEGAYNNIGRMFGEGSEFGRLGEEAGLKLLRGEQLIPYSDPGREQFYQEAFLNPATENFRSDILPSIQESYAGRGLEAGRSGDLLNAEMTAGRRLATDLGAQRANLLRGDQDRALLGLGQAFGAASQPQEIAFNTGQQNRFLQNPYSNPAYGVAPLALGTQPYATRARGGGSNTGQLVGAGFGALGALAGNYLSNRGGGGGYPTRSAGW